MELYHTSDDSENYVSRIAGSSHGPKARTRVDGNPGGGIYTEYVIKECAPAGFPQVPGGRASTACEPRGFASPGDRELRLLGCPVAAGTAARSTPRHARFLLRTLGRERCPRLPRTGGIASAGTESGWVVQVGHGAGVRPMVERDGAHRQGHRRCGPARQGGADDEGLGRMLRTVR